MATMLRRNNSGGNDGQLAKDVTGDEKTKANKQVTFHVHLWWIWRVLIRDL